MSIVHGLPIEVYHGPEHVEHVSKSGLDEFAKSPAIYYARNVDPLRPPRPEPTPAMILGTMTHCAILEPDCFNDRHIIAPKVDRRTKAGKEDWSAFVASLQPGQIPAEADMVAQAQAMAASLRRIKPIRDLLAAGFAEASAFYVDPVTGVKCRVRPDWVSPAGDGAIILDVKTCIDASPAGFAKAVANWNYDKQAAMYSDGWSEASGERVHGFVFAAVEKEYPFAAAAYMLDDDAVDRARRVYRADLRRLDECQKANAWPGYTVADEVQILTLPAWHNPQPKENE